MKSFKDRLDEVSKLLESTADLQRLAEPKTLEKLSNIKIDSKAKAWHDNAFKDSHHVEIPLPPEVPPAVVDHVNSKGGQIDETGHNVRLKSGRVVPTSKFLGKSNAPKHVSAEYQHHLRHASENGNTKLVISKHPGEVASCSTGTNWHSCMSLDKNDLGVHSPDINADIKHGTMIAMHLHKDAKPNKDGEYDAKDVLGRRLIKKHNTDDGKVVYHQEERSYGQFPKSAIDKVEAFTRSHNHDKHIVAFKHPDLYDDDNKTTKVSEDATPERLNHVMDYGNIEAQIAAAGHKNADENVINKAYDHDNFNVVTAALKNPSAPDSFLRKIIKSGPGNMAQFAASNSNLSKAGIHDALNHTNQTVRDSAINHMNPNFEREHFEKAIKDLPPKLLDHPYNHFIKPEHIDKYLDSNLGSVSGAAALHNSASRENLEKALNHSNAFVRAAAVKNKNSTNDILDKAINDVSPVVRKAVFLSGKATPKHIESGIKDEDESVKAIANFHKD